MTKQSFKALHKVYSKDKIVELGQLDNIETTCEGTDIEQTTQSPLIMLTEARMCHFNC